MELFPTRPSPSIGTDAAISAAPASGADHAVLHEYLDAAGDPNAWRATGVHRVILWIMTALGTIAAMPFVAAILFLIVAPFYSAFCYGYAGPNWSALWIDMTATTEYATQFDESAFWEIQSGATFDEVRESLGEPLSSYEDDERQTAYWTYSRTPNHSSYHGRAVTFINGGVSQTIAVCWVD